MKNNQLIDQVDFTSTSLSHIDCWKGPILIVTLNLEYNLIKIQEIM